MKWLSVVLLVMMSSAFAQQKDTSVITLKVSNIDLKISILHKEQNELFDKMDAHKSKSRDMSRLIDIQFQLKKLDKQKKELKNK